MKYFYIYFILATILFSNQKEIEDITFTDNKFLSSEELLSWIPLKKSSIFNKTFYNSRSLKLSAIQLKNLYNSNGYLNVKVNPIVKEISDKISINFIINEGNQYFINDIEFVGNRLFSSAELLKVLDVKVNDIFNPLQITKNLKSIIRNYLEVGKFYISIMDELIEENNKVSIRINISEGKTYFFGNVSVEGLENLKEKLVFRESIISLGQKYNISKIEKSQTRIFSSLLFSSVEIFPQFRNDISDTIDLVIKVKEMNDRDIKGEIGFGQTESPLGENSPPLTSIELNSTIQSGYFFNTPNKFTLKVDLGMTIDENISVTENKLFPKRNISLGYRAPWILGLRIPLNFKVFDYYVEENNDFRHRQGIESSFLYRKSENNKLLGSFIFESVNILGNSDSQKQLERKFRVIHQRHSLDNLISPKSGSFLGIYSILRGAFLGGNTHYILTDIEFKSFHSLFNSLVLGYRIKTGIINILEKTSEESITDFFYLGGSTSLRGWSNPDSLKYNENALYRGLVNLELRFPVYKNLGAELFFDAGILGDRKYDLNNSQYNWNIGYGITFNTTLGPARIDFAYPFPKFKLNTSISLLYSF